MGRIFCFFIILCYIPGLFAMSYQECVQLTNNPPKDGIPSVRHFRQVWDKCHRTFNDDADALVLLNLGRNQLIAGTAEGGDRHYLENAVTTFDKAIKKAPYNARLPELRGIALQELQRYQEAIKSLAKAIKLNPQSSDAHYNRGYVYLKIGNPKKAYEDFVRALRLNPNDAKAKRDRAKVLNSFNRYEEALADISSIVNRFPRDKKLYEIRATSYEGLGEIELAIKELRKSLDIEYDQEITARIDFLGKSRAEAPKEDDRLAQGEGVSRGISITSPVGEKLGSFENSYALLIGVSEYESGWPKLENVPSEITQVSNSLVDRGFSVTKILNPSGKQLKDAFDSFVTEYGLAPDNRLLILFSGHGYTRNQGNKGYLVPADAPNPLKDERKFLSRALSMTRILSLAREIESRHVLFLFDSCFSGTIFKTRALPDEPPLITRLSTMPTRQFITAGGAGEVVPAKSIFIPAFLDAIDHGLGDLNADGYVTGTELGLYLQSTVSRFGNQMPQFGKINDYDLSRGDFIFRSGLKN